MKTFTRSFRRDSVPAIIAILTAIAVSGCCSMGGYDFCFKTPGRGDCPSGYYYISPDIMDSVDLAKSGRGGVIDRSGRGGVIDREDELVNRFCMPRCTGETNCLDKRTTAVIDTGASNKVGYLVGDLDCVTTCDRSVSGNNCTDEPEFDDAALIGSETPFCKFPENTQ